MLEKLKEYKELIAIIVFFLGGIFWLNNQFPTKDDLTQEVGSLNCLLEKYMTVTQLQIRNQELEKHAKDLAVTIAGMESSAANTPLSPAMRFDLDQKKFDLKTNRDQRKDYQGKINKIMDELGRDVCRRMKK